MAKKRELVKVQIDVPDDKWNELVRLTGETDPNRLVDVVLRDFVRIREQGKSSDD